MKFCVLILLYVFSSGCQHEAGEPSANVPVPQDIGSGLTATTKTVSSLFSTSCALSGCHSGLSPAGDLNLEAVRFESSTIKISSSQLPSMVRVKPGFPEQSYLLHKLDGSHIDIGGSGQQMPLGSASLETEHIVTIRFWIDLLQYAIDVDRDGFAPPGDCDDSNIDIHPVAIEVTGNSIDENCDGFSEDRDGDGYLSISQGGGDQDDTDDSIYPGAIEICIDGKDNDQNGEADDGCDPYLDQDLDTFTPNEGDCNDADILVHPGADEIDNGIDNDCDDDAVEFTLFDGDNDNFTNSYGNSLTEVGDCNDGDASIYPGADEIDNGIDQDCDGDAIELGLFDSDNDDFTENYGSTEIAVSDCNDGDPAINPAAAEITGNAVDENCDALIEDRDGDGYIAQINGGNDWDDNNNSIYPGAPEICGDNKDNNQNSVIDDGCDENVDSDEDGHTPAQGDCNDSDPGIAPGVTEVDDGIDQDCDGDAIELGLFDGDIDGFTYNYGSALTAVSDCVDGDATIYPGATESDDGIDQDCDGDAVERVLFDSDGDGFTNSYGSTATAIPDCNDGVGTIFPGASEVDNGVDHDCDGDAIELGLFDGDGDSFTDNYGSSLTAIPDCNDSNPSINPNATEVIGNSVDENCDGHASDQDGDGVDTQGEVIADCDDNDATIFPGATEVLDDGTDQNCDGINGWSWTKIHTNVIAASCSCHWSSAPGGSNLVMSNSNKTAAYNNLINIVSFQASPMDRIEPGDATNSYWMRKLDGTQNSAGGSGSQMPRGGTPISSSDRDELRAWINQGAVDN